MSYLERARASFFLSEVVIDHTVRLIREVPLTQKEMRENRVYLLRNDHNDEAIFWIGRLVPGQHIKILNTYVRELFEENDFDQYTIIKQGLETQSFLNAFPKWDPNMWIKQRLDENDKVDDLNNNLIDIY